MIFDIIALSVAALMMIAFVWIKYREVQDMTELDKYQYDNRELFAFTDWYMTKFDMSHKQYESIRAAVREGGKTYNELYAEFVAAEYQKFLNDKVRAAHERQTKAQEFKEVLNNLDKMNMPIPSVIYALESLDRMSK